MCSAEVQVRRGSCPWASPGDQSCPAGRECPAWCPCLLLAVLSAVFPCEGVTAHLSTHRQRHTETLIHSLQNTGQGCFPKALRLLLKSRVPRLARVHLFSPTRKRSFREPSLNRSLLQSRRAVAERVLWGTDSSGLLSAAPSVHHGQELTCSPWDSLSTAGLSLLRGSLPCTCHACTSLETERFLTKGSSELPVDSPSSRPCWHTCTERADLLSLLHFSSIPEQVARPGSI